MPKGYKFSEEVKKKISESNKGKHFFKHTDEAKIKIGLASKGNQYAKGMKPNITSFKKGCQNIVSDETRKKLSEALKGRKMPWMIGEKNKNWKGGITSLNKLIRVCFEYRQWRSDVFTRDDFTCRECGEKGCYLEAHHIKLFIDILEEYNIKTIEEAKNCSELWNINNGITLCKKCHNKTKKCKH